MPVDISGITRYDTADAAAGGQSRLFVKAVRARVGIECAAYTPA